MFPTNNYTLTSGLQSQSDVIYIDLFGSSLLSTLEIMGINGDNSCIHGLHSEELSREIHNVSMYSGTLSIPESFRIIGCVYQIIAILFDRCTPNQWNVISYDDPAIVYTGTWESITGRNCDIKIACNINSYAEFTFQGTGIKWFGTMDNNSGYADIFIDGVLQETIDTYSSSMQTKQLLYSNTQLLPGIHTIRIGCNGNKNERSTDVRISLDNLQNLGIYTDNENEIRISNSTSVLITKCLTILKTTYYENFSMDNLAEQLGVSRSYLSTRFKSETGLTISKYITNLRMSRAKTLLAASNKTINDIATSLGYQDVFYFSRAFKKTTGITPSVYRRMNRQL